MATIAEILERFRRAAAPPGAAAPAGVPRDLKAELSEELRDVFRAVDAMEAEAARLTSDADHDAERMRRAAQGEAEQVIETARLDIAAVRMQAHEERRLQRRNEIVALDEEADRQIVAVRQRAASRIPAVVDRILADLMEEAGPVADHVELVGRG